MGTISDKIKAELAKGKRTINLADILGNQIWLTHSPKDLEVFITKRQDIKNENKKTRK